MVTAVPAEMLAAVEIDVAPAEAPLDRVVAVPPPVVVRSPMMLTSSGTIVSGSTSPDIEKSVLMTPS